MKTLLYAFGQKLARPFSDSRRQRFKGVGHPRVAYADGRYEGTDFAYTVRIPSAKANWSAAQAFGFRIR